MQKRNLLIGALLAVALPLAWGGQGLPDKFDPDRDAAADLALALSIAQAQSKRVLIDVGGEWCTWCHVLDRFIARNEEVRALLDSSYVLVKVNYSPRNKNEQVLSRWPKVAGYPHMFVLDASGRLIHSQSSAELESGKDYDKSKVIAFLRR
jgi:thiol:disulfide interchange protein